MDNGRFDDLARALGATGTRRAGLQAALGAVLGLGVAGAALEAVAEQRGDADAAKRRHQCGPDAPCPANSSCVKQGRKRRCVCATTTCGASCCADGEICQGGVCVTPGPGACIEFAQPCKNVGVPCCDGYVCGSGQGGEGDVACYVPAGGGCDTSGDCTYGSECLMGLCVANPQPQPEPEPTPDDRCVPNVPVTGNAATDGAALLAALDAAKSTPDSVISLGAGEYFLGIYTSEDAAYDWNSANAVTVRACPGADAVITADVGNGPGIFLVSQGSLTFRGPGLTVKATSQNYNYGFKTKNSGSLTLEDVNVEDVNTGVLIQNASSAKINGGKIVTVYQFPTAISVGNNSTSTISCSPNPTVVGPCWCPSSSVCPSNGACCTTWQS